MPEEKRKAVEEWCGMPTYVTTPIEIDGVSE
jgi:hypothetical protein